MSKIDRTAIELALLALREQPQTARRLNAVSSDFMLWLETCEDIFPVMSYGRASSAIATALEIMEARGELADPTDAA